MSGVYPTAAIGAGEDFHYVTARIVKIDTPTVIPMIDLLRLPMRWVRPIGQARRLHPMEDGAKLVFRHQKSVVAGTNVLVCLDEIQ